MIGRNELVEEGGTLRAKDTGEREELECGLVLRSVGYTGVPIEGVPFDEKRGLILNDGGRVLDPTTPATRSAITRRAGSSAARRA